MPPHSDPPPDSALAADDYRQALDAGEIGTWSWDLATGRMRWSAQMFRNLGLEPEAGDDFFASLMAVIHPSDREATERAFAEFRGRVGPMRVEARLIWPGDEPHWVVFLGCRSVAGADGVVMAPDARHHDRQPEPPPQRRVRRRGDPRERAAPARPQRAARPPFRPAPPRPRREPRARAGDLRQHARLVDALPRRRRMAASSMPT